MADPKPKKKIARKDPTSRSMNGAYEWGQVKNRDPNKHYVGVNMADDIQGIDYYHHLGYDVVEYQGEGSGGEEWRGGRTNTVGEELTNRGHVLMCIDKEKHAALTMRGPDGLSGQERADRLENQIVDKRGGVDELRGMHREGRSAGYSVENETEAPEEVPV